MDFLSVINDLIEHMKDERWGIESIEAMPDLSKYQKQPTEMKTLPDEYVYQVGDGDYGFYGTIYFPLGHSKEDGGNLFLKVWFG